jgi:hypothetical protein
MFAKGVLNKQKITVRSKDLKDLKRFAEIVLNSEHHSPQIFLISYSESDFRSRNIKIVKIPVDL